MLHASNTIETRWQLASRQWECTIECTCGRRFSGLGKSQGKAEDLATLALRDHADDENKQTAEDHAYLKAAGYHSCIDARVTQTTEAYQARIECVCGFTAQSTGLSPQSARFYATDQYLDHCDDHNANPENLIWLGER